MAIVQFIDDKVLFVTELVAMHENCCCGPCYIPPWDCGDYFEVGTRGVAGSQPQVQVDIDSSLITNVDSAEPCTNDCEGCPNAFDSTFVLDPCGLSQELTIENRVQCNGGGLASYDPTQPMDVSVQVSYNILTTGNQTKATVSLSCVVLGRGTCDDTPKTPDATLSRTYEITVANPDTYKYEGANCTDPTLTDEYPGKIVGTFTLVSETLSYNQEGGGAPYTGVGCTDMEQIVTTVTLL